MIGDHVAPSDVSYVLYGRDGRWSEAMGTRALHWFSFSLMPVDASITVRFQNCCESLWAALFPLSGDLKFVSWDGFSMTVSEMLLTDDGPKHCHKWKINPVAKGCGVHWKLTLPLVLKTAAAGEVYSATTSGFRISALGMVF